MLCFPNCKINIGLYITNRRADGYHDLETVFYPLNFCDVLEVVGSSHTMLHPSGLQIAGVQDDNLVLKAYNMLSGMFPAKVPAMDIYLHKVLPMGAGLGGGSADGAFMLSLLNDYCSLGLSKHELIPLALQLGSDCPFFINNKPQVAKGRGEIMTDTALDLSGYSIQLLMPGLHVSTGKAFGTITPKPAPFDLNKLILLPITEWRDKISNDFEAPVFGQFPILAALKERLYSQGALYASMSGSGSAVYGIFPKGKKADIAEYTTLESYYQE